MGILQMVNLLRIANNNLPSVQHRYEQLQKQNNNLESILATKAKEFQNLSNQITYMNKRLDDIKSECSTESATLEYLRQQIAKLEAFVYDFTLSMHNST
jgi:chromosome segregation ATPase